MRLWGILCLAIMWVSCRPQQKESNPEIVPQLTHISDTEPDTPFMEPQRTQAVWIHCPAEGRLEQILVREGQKVKEGDLLAYLIPLQKLPEIEGLRKKGARIDHSIEVSRSTYYQNRRLHRLGQISDQVLDQSRKDLASGEQEKVSVRQEIVALEQKIRIPVYAENEGMVINIATQEGVLVKMGDKIIRVDFL